MCGILGWLGAQGAADAARFDAALDLLAHRGPDDRGVWSAPNVLLGHRRLSIVDLTSTGHQPMLEPATGAVIVFNGEIYNHVELRTQLEALGHQFLGRSDTEVLLHALIEWGEAALPKLNGMWAFAFWQPSSRRLMLARDRFGVKPLYYRNGSGGLAFASEPKALLSLFPEHRVVNEPVLLEFLSNNLLYARNESFYQGIYLLPPAHYAIYAPDTGRWQSQAYWHYPADEDDGLSLEEAVEQFEALLNDAVRLRMRSDVPVGLALSGGLDSTGVLAAAGRHSTAPLTCFTSIYSDAEVGELPWAELAAKSAHAPLIAVPAPPEDWLTTLHKVAWHMDAPGYSPAVYPLWKLMQRARAERVPVLLEGQGADEALAGYPQYAVLDLLDYILGKDAKPTLSCIQSRFNALQQTFSFGWTVAWLARELSPTLLRWHRRRSGFHSLLREGIELSAAPVGEVTASGNRAKQRLLSDHSRNILPGLMQYGDAISMAHGIEARNPFLDYRLVEWMFRMSARLRFNNGETKWVLRQYLRKNGQSAIGNRPDKKGYPTPIRKWLASEHEAQIEALLLAPDSQLHRWCDPKKIKRLIEMNKKGALATEHHLYKLVSTQLWLNVCIAQDGSR